MDGRIEPASRDLIARHWQREWGVPIVTPEREYRPEDVEGLVWRAGDRVPGLVTWYDEGGRAEIVTLDAAERRRGIGTRLMEAVEEELRRRGLKVAHLVTTNDNTVALAFYVRRGYRLVRLHLDAMDRVRRAKPDVPSIGNDGIPLRDMWELEKGL